jgi:hypothetical protein
MEELTYENATHLLSCKHCIGPSTKRYAMRCHVLKVMGGGRLKILVFGRLYWRDTEHIRKVRYVEDWRLTPRALDRGDAPAKKAVSPDEVTPDGRRLYHAHPRQVT